MYKNVFSLIHSIVSLVVQTVKITCKGNSNLLQYSCPENSINRGAWQATVYGVSKSRTQLSD